MIVANWDEHGGLQRRTRALAAALSEWTPVTALTWTRGTARRPIARAVEVRAPCLVSWARDHSGPLARVNTALSVASAWGAAARRRMRFDVVYAASPNPEGLVAAGLHRALGLPYVVDTWLPGPLGNVARLDSSPLAGPVKAALGGASAYLAATDEVAGELRAAGFDPDRVIVVPPGVDLERLAPSPQRRLEARRRLGLGADSYMVCLARFDLRQKRHDLLLEGWRAARLEGWRLVLAGDGPDRARVERLARGIVPEPLFPGWQEPEPWLAAADASALPTNFEATGSALIEGMAAGLPGLASATTTYRALAPDGVLLVRNDPEGWADALGRLTSDRALRERLGPAARACAVRAFDQRTEHVRIAQLLGVASVPATGRSPKPAAPGERGQWRPRRDG
jgi:glycosyltransferase involved in cell wall biosynthesis